MTERPAAPRGIALLLASLAALGPFSIDTYLPSFHDIGATLHATPIEVQQTLSAYLLAFAVMTLWHGALSDRFGRRVIILWALALFGFALLAGLIGAAVAFAVAWLVARALTPANRSPATR